METVLALTPMVGGTRIHGNLRFASGDHSPFHRLLPPAVSATHGRWPGAGGSKDPCYTAEQNRQSAIMNAAKMRAMENASNAVKYPAAVALT
ncbi:hypothetical protein [Aeromonas molluscorum]|uniref:Uncharacterized protein n=1 Tax=Aeromonas molluscorum 848 TaxID=1268236 RepID=R1GY29_9GAMM|nr:hypothetical protein [Aeromonas molluscorum]EOD53316.1 hypothetical protein G113_20307 [Aeromonas molluscorum 848]